jgi:3-phytase
MRLLTLACTLLAVQGQAQLNGKERESRSLSYFEISPIAETTPVASPEDAADDICIYVPQAASEPVLIIGTDKKNGLNVYTLDGSLLRSYKVGRVNNVDLIMGDYPIVVTSNRSFNSIDFYRLYADGSLNLLHRELTGLKDVYGITADSGVEYSTVFISDKKGNVLEYKVKIQGEEIISVLTTRVRFSSVVEGLEVDSYYKRLYAAQEDKGLWVLDLNDPKRKARRLVFKTDKKEFKADFEGVALAETSASTGMIFISIQGSNAYAILDREDLSYEGYFRIIANRMGVDGAEETDGIDVSTHPRARIFIAQDGFNDMQNQNFKIVSFDQLQKAILQN